MERFKVLPLLHLIDRGRVSPCTWSLTVLDSLASLNAPAPGMSCLCLQSWDYRMATALSWLLLDSGDPQSDPHVYTGSALSTKPSPQPLTYFGLLFKIFCVLSTSSMFCFLT